MSDPGTRERFEELLNARLDGDTSRDDELLKMVAADRSLRDEFQTALLLAEGLDCLPAHEPGPAFTAQVMARVGAAQARGLAGLVARLYARPGWRIAPAAALLLVVLSAGFLLGRLTTPGAPSPGAMTASNAPAGATVKFVYHAPSASSVRLVGDFNQWNKEKTPLRKSSDGYWTIELEFKPGRYNYLFYIDETRWAPDPAASLNEDDDFGRKNSVLEI